MRDLAFSLYSESLLHAIADSPATPYSLDFDASARAWLTELDKEPTALLAHLAQRTSTRLGLYFEALWSFYWRYVSSHRLLAHNLQLNRQGKTLGALDFVIERSDGALVHIEAAAKFYLANRERPDQTDIRSPWQSAYYDWIGPNANDRLAWKLEHMSRHQLPLSTTPEALTALQEKLGKPPVVHSQFLLRGCLFWPAVTPPALDAQAVLPSDDISRLANTGRWWHLADFLTQESLPGCDGFTLLPRNHWLSPACYPSAVVPLSLGGLKQALLAQITQRRQGVMAVGLQRRDEQWCESYRLFVVPNHWPGAARPARST